MKFKKYITEKKVALLGDERKDYFIKLLNKWDTDFSKMTKAYRSLKVPNRMDFYELNDYNNQQLKKNYMKHPDMKKFMMLKKAFSTFGRNFEKWIYTKILDQSKSSGEGYYKKEVRSTAWMVIIDTSDGSLFPSEYDNVSGKHVNAPWRIDTSSGGTRKQNITRYQGRWRKFKEAFREMIDVEAYELEDKPIKDEQVQVSGVNVLIKNKGKDDDVRVKKFLSSLRGVSKAIKKHGFSKVLQDMHIELNFSVSSEGQIYSAYGSLLGGTYNPNNDKLIIFPLGIDRKLSDSTLIHELAHRYWFKYIPDKAKQAWKEKFKSQSVEIKQDHIKKFMDMFFTEEDGFDYRKEMKIKVEKIEEPTLKIVFRYLIDRMPMYKAKDGKTLYDTYMEHYQHVAKGQMLPLEWITDYGRTDEKESFAEAFKLWVGGVKGKLGPWTRAFFKEIVRTGGANIKEEKETIDKYI